MKELFTENSSVLNTRVRGQFLNVSKKELVVDSRRTYTTLSINRTLGWESEQLQLHISKDL